MKSAKTYFLYLGIFGLIIVFATVYYLNGNIVKNYLPLYWSVLPDSDLTESYSDSPNVANYSVDTCQPTVDNVLNVHFIMHSHDDPGWLKTPEEYYRDDVRQILYSVTNELLKDKKRRFVYSEMYFFKKWWEELDSTTQDEVKDLVKNGQLEFVGGGWVQNDDALSHYAFAIDQMSYGLNFIKSIFGLRAKPSFAWQIDSFGYSREQAALFAQAGYDVEVIQRLPWYDIDERRENAEMEFIWQGDTDNKIFTHVLYESYVAPEGFRYETNNDKLTNQNVKKKFNSMIEIADKRSKSYKTNHLLLLMGHDFVYKNASTWFDAVDKLIDYQKLDSGEGKPNFLYSTPSCYFKAVKSQLSETNLSIKTEDFFPYCNNRNSMWTGYFSSRPTFKGFIQKVGSLLQTVQNLESLISNEKSRRMLNEMRENFFTTLHHDAITGTCKQAVADDYIRSLVNAEVIGQKLLKMIYVSVSGLTDRNNDKPKSFAFCPLLNISVCEFTENRKRFTVTIFNGQSKTRQEYVSIPVNNANYAVYDNEEERVDFQVNKITKSTQLRNTKTAKFNILFPANMPPLGYSTYIIEQTNIVEKSMKTLQPKSSISNEFFRVDFNANTGAMIGVENLQNGEFLPLTQQYLWYENSASGAYIFRPTKVHDVLNAEAKITLKYNSGIYLQEMKQTFNEWVSQSVKLYKGKNYIEFQWTVGPLMEDVGKELVTRFITMISNNDTFYTDANSRQFVKRSSTPIHSPDYPIASVYFPTTSAVMINDTKNQLVMLTDRPMGGSSLYNGSMEVLAISYAKQKCTLTKRPFVYLVRYSI